jgi:uncharacterized delta-60 repeat protein
MRGLAVWAVATTVATTSAIAATSGGALDSTFGGDGRVVTDLGSDEGAVAVAVLPDGKILVAAPTALLRYDSSGVPDATFDDDGIRPLSGFVASDMAIAPGGKIVVVGTADSGGDELANLAVARFDDDGTPDATFSEDGLATPDFGFANEWASGVAVQPDGKVVVVGNTDANHELGNGIVARFTDAGTPDPSFGSPNGLRSAFPFGFPDSAAAVSLRPNGKVVVAGATYFIAKGADRADLDLAVARFHTDGTRDTSFSGDGAVRTRFGPDRSDRASDVLVQADGRIVAGGSTQKGTSGDFALARYTTRGRLDQTFSSDGKVRTDFLGGFDAAHGIALQANGRIVLAGEASSTFAFARYTTRGRLDATFSGDGKRRTRFGSNDRDYAADVLVQPDGRIVVGGRVTTGTTTVDIGLARYLP